MTPIAIYDTTLRDGTQAEGISLSLADKLRVARRLDELGFDYVEGGWPGSNPKDEQFFAALADEPLRRARLTAFGSTRRRGVAAEDDPQLRLLVDARTPVVALVAKSWDFHVRVVLKTTPEENLAMIADSVRFLKEQGREVVLDAEHFFDGYRENPEYALDALRAAAGAGADWLVLCDTNGGSVPSEVAAAVARVRGDLGPGRAAVGIHTHNDGELAVANALAAVEAGATQVQGTINGYGERTGNANLCSLVPDLVLKLGRGCGVDVCRLTELSRFVDEVAHVPPNKRLPYVGEDAFAHKGGIHVHAVAADPRTYEHVDPASVGNERRILISELSGRNNVLERARALGLELDGDVATAVVARVKQLENEGFRFEDAEASFELLAHRAAPGYRAPFDAVSYTIRSHEDAEGSSAEATVELRVGGRPVEARGEGSGPVNALEHALRAALADAYPSLTGFALTGFRAEVLEGRAGSRGPVRVWTRGSAVGCGSWATVGSSTGLLDAAWLALLDAAEYAIARVCPVPATEEAVA